MWPFSRRDEVTDEWKRDIEQRLKVIEREHDDLHAAYRKLRAIHAREHVGLGQPVSRTSPDADVENLQRLDKQALRDRFLPRPNKGNGA
jgi:hypothetical protein